jgi:acyl-CoA synthetase (AMP-forming)/AMP-acid ligase II
MRFNLADMFESVAGAFPERTALVCGGRRLSYAELDERANRLADHLLSRGLGGGDHVGVHLHNGTEFVECMLAAFKIGAVPINVNYRYVAEELRFLFDDADLVALVHQRAFSPQIAPLLPSLPRLRHLITVDDGGGATPPPGSHAYDAALAAASASRQPHPQRSPDDHYVIYTGGTTGIPRGVVWRQEDLFFAGMGGGNPTGEPVQRPEELVELARSKDAPTMFPVPPLMHGAAQLGTFIGLLAGGKVVLVPHFDPAEVWRLVAAEGVNAMSIVGDAMARPLAEHLATNPAIDASSLLAISSAGAIFSETVKQQLARMLPAVMLLDNFGASETGFQGTGTPDASPDRGLKFTMNARTAVLDDELRVVAPGSGVVGRVALSGHIPLGYYKDPVKTAQVFVTTADGTRWVIPGDLATANKDGSITVLGRGSVCINSGGEKIFPEEVEAALKSHPAVFDAVVVGVVDERWGERVTAVVAPRPGEAPRLDDLVEHCRDRLARYKLPRDLVTVTEVVRSPSGKPDYGWAQTVARERTTMAMTG